MSTLFKSTIILTQSKSNIVYKITCNSLQDFKSLTKVITKQHQLSYS